MLETLDILNIKYLGMFNKIQEVSIVIVFHTRTRTILIVNNKDELNNNFKTKKLVKYNFN